MSWYILQFHFSVLENFYLYKPFISLVIFIPRFFKKKFFRAIVNVIAALISFLVCFSSVCRKQLILGVSFVSCYFVELAYQI